MMIKRSNLRVHWTEEGDQIQTKAQKTYPMIGSAETLPNLAKDIDLQVQQAFRIQNTHKQK